MIRLYGRPFLGTVNDKDGEQVQFCQSSFQMKTSQVEPTGAIFEKNCAEQNLWEQKPRTNG